ncbi:MAG: hypothetical protein NT178_01280 [Proteobacteria bacterium]|nr:hypothetical protein [Pseudomonadota bacterium]
MKFPSLAALQIVVPLCFAPAGGFTVTIHKLCFQETAKLTIGRLDGQTRTPS